MDLNDGIITKNRIYHLILDYRYSLGAKITEQMLKEVSEIPTVVAEPVGRGKWIVSDCEANMEGGDNCETN